MCQATRDVSWKRFLLMDKNRMFFNVDNDQNLKSIEVDEHFQLIENSLESYFLDYGTATEIISLQNYLIVLAYNILILDRANPKVIKCKIEYLTPHKIYIDRSIARVYFSRVIDQKNNFYALYNLQVGEFIEEYLI